MRFICGTQEIHRQLEAKISEFLGTDDTILYTSCFDANGGLFETLLDSEDAVFSDEQTGSSWNILGQAIAGPLAGAELDLAVHQNEFWFAWAAFNDGSPVYGG